MSQQVFFARRRVEWSHTDAGGIAHFTAFLRYFEEVEHEFLRSLGLSVHERESDAVLTWPRVHAQCDFRSPVRFEQLLDIELSVVRLGEKSVTYGFRLSHADRLVAEGSLTAVCCRLRADAPPEPVAIPARIADKLRPFVRPPDRPLS